MEWFLKGFLISFPLVFLAMSVINLPEFSQEFKWGINSKKERLATLLSYIKANAVVAGFVSLVVSLVIVWVEWWVPWVKNFVNSVV